MTKKLEQCGICGSENIERQENQQHLKKFKMSNKIKELHLTGLNWEKCLDCGEVYFNPDDCDLYEQKIKTALETDRKKKRLLTAQEIKEIRQNLGYSQAKLEKLLGFSNKSFARWETYKTDQSKAADLLLRAIKKGGKELLNSLLDEQETKKKNAA